MLAYLLVGLVDLINSIYSICFSLQLGQENYDFFPMNRALCLSTIDIDSTESKIDDLLHQVTSIAQKQRDDVSSSLKLWSRQTGHTSDKPA